MDGRGRVDESSLRFDWAEGSCIRENQGGTLTRQAGGNQHALKGDLAGKSAIDLGGSGKGRGAERVIFSAAENEVIIHDIVDYHKWTQWLGNIE
jgi:hypothetical protein